MNEKLNLPTDYHKSVLVNEVLTGLNIRPGKTYVDCTFGGGGHTRAILMTEPTTKVIAFDWDKVAIDTNAESLIEEFGDRFKIIFGNFAQIQMLLKKAGIEKVDGILADFGTSQHQIHHKEGFSFSVNTPLDMRMSNSHTRRTAAHILAQASEKELSEIFFVYGEERHSRAIARVIVEERKHTPLKTTFDLVSLIEKIIPRTFSNGKAGIHPATRVFQALRIVVNEELDHIETFLKHAIDCMNPEARIACISFHSLEDRIVKYFYREHKEQLEVLTKKPIEASEDECRNNSSSRCATLRVAQFINKHSL